MVNKKTVDMIRKYYHAYRHNEGYKARNLGFGFIHYAFIRNLRPPKVICIGSNRGYIPSICALACKNDNRGKVDFVDAGYSRRSKKEIGRAWGGVGVWITATRDYWKPLGIEDYIDLYVMTTEDFLKKHPDRKYNYITIDGDHSYEGVKKDYTLLWDRLLPNGFMCFHSTLVEKETPSGKCGVKKFWDEIRNVHFNFELNFSSGLGIIQK